MKAIPAVIVIGGIMVAGLVPAVAQSPPAATGASAQSQAAPPAEAAVTRPAAPAAKPLPGARAAKAAAGGTAGKAMDRLELDTSQITGNRELPKVMVVVPWKRSDIGDLVGRPVNSLVDEALQPVDREVFRREIDYYGALTPDRPRVATGVTGAPGVTEATAGKAIERPEK
jgi:hypothetical protein